MSPLRNIAFMVVDSEIDTNKADKFWDAKFKFLQRMETSSYDTALKLLDEYRERISLLVILTMRQRDELEKILEKIEGIPFVLIVIKKDVRDQLEKILEGKRIREPFDAVLESWLRQNLPDLKS
jgi:phosphoglycolate phosphatase-like HAD superfamily hydrolase